MDVELEVVADVTYINYIAAGVSALYKQLGKTLPTKKVTEVATLINKVTTSVNDYEFETQNKILCQKLAELTKLLSLTTKQEAFIDEHMPDLVLIDPNQKH